MGGLANADVIRGGRSMLTVADRGRGIKFAKILLTSYGNAPLINLFLNKETDIVALCMFNICLATFLITLVRYSKESFG